jgi:hypothetical protein
LTFPPEYATLKGKERTLMGNKIYKVALEITDTSTEAHLKYCCEGYEHIFNKVLDILFDKMSYGIAFSEQLMEFNSLLEKVEEDIKEIQKYKKLEEGIVKKAVEASYTYFNKWWYIRITTPNENILPSHMKSTSYFRTSTILKVSKGGFLYFPKYKRVKLRDRNYIPVGSYKNATVEKNCNRWYVVMEAIEASSDSYNLEGNVEVHIDSDGNLAFADKFYSNILRKDSYQEVSKKLRKLAKKAKKERKFSLENVKGIEKDIEWLRFRRQNLRTSYFQSIVRDIVLTSPAELKFIYDPKNNENQSFSSQFFKDSDTLTLIKMIKRKLSSMGTKITYSENIKEVVLEKLNS